MYSATVESEQRRIYALSSILTAVASIAVALRLLSKKVVKASYAADDWWIMASLVGQYAESAVLIWGNAGRSRVSSLPAYNVNRFKSLLIGACFYPFLTTTIKISVLCLYRRIFSTQKFRTLFLYVGIVAVLWFFAVELASIMVCLPPKKYWNRETPGTCLNFNVFTLAYAICETIIDTVILCLPLRMISTLQLSRRRKILLSGIFLMGGLVIIALIFRLNYTYQPHAFHINYHLAEVWSLIHVVTGIICACLPTYGPLFPKTKTLLSSIRQRYGFRFSSHRLMDSSSKNAYKGKNNNNNNNNNPINHERGDPHRGGDHRYLTEMRGGGDQSTTGTTTTNVGHDDDGSHEYPNNHNQILVRSTVEIV